MFSGISCVFSMITQGTLPREKAPSCFVRESCGDEAQLRELVLGCPIGQGISLWHQNLQPPECLRHPDRLKKHVFRNPMPRIRHRPGRIATMSSDASYVCDACGKEIVIPIDPAAGATQEYVEDCPVCCRANVIHVEIDQDGEARVWAKAE